mmetsp:Transcript_32790/g.101662  ORF Transcript_32790/g.101662 Transcript_32790/m.101662 type:complete len:227 (-) Transcript_32790:1031-1711(-)
MSSCRGSPVMGQRPPLATRARSRTDLSNAWPKGERTGSTKSRLSSAQQRSRGAPSSSPRSPNGDSAASVGAASAHAAASAAPALAPSASAAAQPPRAAISVARAIQGSRHAARTGPRQRRRQPTTWAARSGEISSRASSSAPRPGARLVFAARAARHPRASASARTLEETPPLPRRQLRRKSWQLLELGGAPYAIAAQSARKPRSEGPRAAPASCASQYETASGTD